MLGVKIETKSVQNTLIFLYFAIYFLETIFNCLFYRKFSILNPFKNFRLHCRFLEASFMHFNQSLGKTPENLLCILKISFLICIKLLLTTFLFSALVFDVYIIEVESQSYLQKLLY